MTVGVYRFAGRCCSKTASGGLDQKEVAMTRHRFTRSAALALTLAAVAAPTAAASNPDQQFPRPATEQGQDFRMPDTRDYAEGRGTYNAPEVVVVKLQKPEIAPAGGIDWTDAGIGAGSVFALSLIGIGGALLLMRKQVGPAFRAGVGS
jgi:hypothetical protein